MNNIKAPDFKLKDQYDNYVALPKKGVVVLYFYPKAGTPGCTREANKFRELYPDFIREGAMIIGVSPDNTKKLAGFCNKYNLPFPLLSDEDKKVAVLYGAWGKKSMYGKEYEGIIRKTFLIVDGNIVREWAHKPEKTEQEVLNEIIRLNKKNQPI